MTPGSARVKIHRESQAKKGLVHVHVWVPKGQEDEIRKAAEKLRKELVAA